MTTYTSIDQLPPEYREQAAAQMANKRPSRHPALRADLVVKGGQPVARQSREIRAQTGVTEKDIQDAMIDLLRLSGWLVLRINGGSMTVGNEGGNGRSRYVRFAYWYGPGCESDSGIPDIIAMRNGRCILVEVKRPDKRGNLSAHQRSFQQAAVEVGAEHYVLCSVDELATLLAALEAG